MAISFVGHACALADTVALPTIEAGDVAFVHAWAASIPDLDADYTNINTLDSGAAAQRVGYRILDGTETDIGTWTGATSVQVSVYRGLDPGRPFGAQADLTVSIPNDRITSPGLTIVRTDGTSWILTFSVHSAATDVDSRSINLCTNRSSGHAENSTGAWDTNGGVSSWTVGQNAQVNAAGVSANQGIELIEHSTITGDVPVVFGIAGGMSFVNPPNVGSVTIAFAINAGMSFQHPPIAGNVNVDFSVNGGMQLAYSISGNVPVAFNVDGEQLFGWVRNGDITVTFAINGTLHFDLWSERSAPPETDWEEGDFSITDWEERSESEDTWADAYDPIDPTWEERDNPDPTPWN